MPKISLYKERRGNTFKYIDKQIKQIFDMSCVGINVHKYLGSGTNTNSDDPTQPSYPNQSAQNIQDLLFLENRERKYEKDVYDLRGHYMAQDIDYNLTQFGLMLSNDTIYMTFHLNDMVSRLGRKIISGDVLELPNRRDYFPLDETIPTALRKYYVVQETSFANEGFSATWYPHLWRCKLTPMVNSQEYQDILNQEITDSDGNPTNNNLANTLSTYLKNLEINDAIISQAENDVPKSGYDTTALYILPKEDGVTPTHDILGYLVGDGIPPNGLAVTSDVAFPITPVTGQYVLRTDYFPHRLFRYDGKRWRAIESEVRNYLTGNTNLTDRGTFINNKATTRLANGAVIDQKQALSSLLKINPDNIG